MSALPRCPLRRHVTPCARAQDARACAGCACAGHACVCACEERDVRACVHACVPRARHGGVLGHEKKKKMTKKNCGLYWLGLYRHSSAVGWCAEDGTQSL